VQALVGGALPGEQLALKAEPLLEERHAERPPDEIAVGVGDRLGAG
jgi:hypothetical protein